MLTRVNTFSLLEEKNIQNFGLGARARDRLNLADLILLESWAEKHLRKDGVKLYCHSAENTQLQPSPLAVSVSCSKQGHSLINMAENCC